MFLKPFRVKSQTSIKGSDRKKIRNDVGKTFPKIPADQLQEIVPAKEEMTVMKIYTHAGDNVIVYCIAKNPIFFELDRVIYPTVYTLWKFPDMMTVFTTWPPVFSKISSGADLMLPGVIVAGEVTPRTFESINKGHPCCVKLLGNKAPVAVGKTAMSGGDMYESAMRGKGVHILHTYKDLLWAHGEKEELPVIDDSEYVKAARAEDNNSDDEDADEVVNDTAVNDCGDVTHVRDESAATETSELSQNVADLDLETHNDDNENCDTQHTAEVGGACALEPCEESDEEEDDGLTPQERMDNLLFHCFLCAIKSSVKKSDLPLLTSAFFKVHLMAFCPEGQNIDVKKSSYKKLGKFLHSMQQKGFIKVKELSKGVDSIVEVHKDHLELRGFVVPEKIVRPDTSTPPASESEFQPPEIVELYCITAATLPLFKSINARYSKGTALTVSEIRQSVTDYVKSNELQHKSQVKLDPVLTSLLLQRDEQRESLRWDDLLTRLFQKMSSAYQFTVSGQKPVVKKGKLEPVTLKVVTRSGNKKVTLINNLELYGVDLQEFAHCVQKGVACSSTVSQLPGKTAGMEVLVQGNQVHFIANLLFDKYKLPKKFLQGLELAPKSGKKKR